MHGSCQFVIVFAVPTLTCTADTACRRPVIMGAPCAIRLLDMREVPE